MYKRQGNFPVSIKAQDKSGNVGSCQVMCEIKIKESKGNKKFEPSKAQKKKLKLPKETSKPKESEKKTKEKQTKEKTTKKVSEIKKNVKQTETTKSSNENTTTTFSDTHLRSCKGKRPGKNKKPNKHLHKKLDRTQNPT